MNRIINSFLGCLEEILPVGGAIGGGIVTVVTFSEITNMAILASVGAVVGTIVGFLMNSLIKRIQKYFIKRKELKKK